MDAFLAADKERGCNNSQGPEPGHNGAEPKQNKTQDRGGAGGRLREQDEGQGKLNAQR